MYDSSFKFTKGEDGRITPEAYVCLNDLAFKMEALLLIGVLHDRKVLENLLAALKWYAADDFRGGGAE